MDRRLGRILEDREDRDEDARVAVGERRRVGRHASHRPAEDPDLGHCPGRARRRRPGEDRLDRLVVELVEEQRADDARTRLAALGREVVDARVRHREGGLGQRRCEGPERLERGLARGDVVRRVDEHHDDRRLEVMLLGHERQRRRRHDERDRREVLRRGFRDRDEAREDLLRQRQEQRPAEDPGDRVELEDEAGDDAEVAAAAADRPEQVGVAILAGDDDPAVGGDDLDRDEAVDRQAVLADEPADPATEREPGQADAGRVAERRREPVGRGRDRVLAGGQPRLGPREASLGIDVETLHRRQVDDDAAVGRAVARDAVAARPDGELEVVVPGEGDAPGHVGGVGRADDEDRLAIEERRCGRGAPRRTRRRPDG